MVDIISILASLAMYTAYNLFMRWKIKKQPLFTIQGVSEICRRQWLTSIIVEKNAILAVQTLRNATMTSTFMASTSVLLSVGVLSLTSNSVNVGHTWHALNVFGNIDQGVLAFKILMLLLNLFVSFFCFSSAIRLYSHVGFMIGAAMESDKYSLPNYFIAEYLDRGAKHFYLGMRYFYYTVPLVFWIFGVQFLLFGTLFIIVALYIQDRAPHYAKNTCDGA